MLRVLCVAVIVLCNPRAAISAEARTNPSVTVEVSSHLPAESTSESRRGTRVSNTERIALRVRLVGAAGTENGENLPVVRAAAATIDALHVQLPVKQSAAGSRFNGRDLEFDVLLEIPISEEERRVILGTYVDRLLERTTDPAQKAELLRTRAVTVSALERFFVQNRTGEFRVTVDVATPSKVLGSASVDVTIVDRGTFIDVLTKPRVKR